MTYIRNTGFTHTSHTQHIHTSHGGIHERGPGVTTSTKINGSTMCHQKTHHFTAEIFKLQVTCLSHPFLLLLYSHIARGACQMEWSMGLLISLVHCSLSVCKNSLLIQTSSFHLHQQPFHRLQVPTLHCKAQRQWLLHKKHTHLLTENNVPLFNIACHSCTFKLGSHIHGCSDHIAFSF